MKGYDMGLNYIIQGIMYLEKLIELVPAPANPVGNDDSSIVYKKLGIYLPEDYDPQKEYPVLVQFYETHSGELLKIHT